MQLCRPVRDGRHFHQETVAAAGVDRRRHRPQAIQRIVGIAAHENLRGGRIERCDVSVVGASRVGVAIAEVQYVGICGWIVIA